MVDEATEGEGTGDGQQLLLHDGPHRPVGVDGPAEHEAGPRQVDLIADGGHHLLHLEVGLNFCAHLSGPDAVAFVVNLFRPNFNFIETLAKDTVPVYPPLNYKNVLYLPEDTTFQDP